MMFNYLTNRVEEMTVDIADASNQLVDFFLRKAGFDEPLTNRAPASRERQARRLLGPRRRPMGMDVGAKSGVRSDINITPLVTWCWCAHHLHGDHAHAPARQERRAAKARHAVPGKGEVEPAFISVTKAGEVFVEQGEAAGHQGRALREDEGGRTTPGQRLMLKADMETEYGKVRPVLDLAPRPSSRVVSAGPRRNQGK